MAEKSEDYAVAAAREWFTPSREAAERENASHRHCDRCEGVLQSIEQNAQQLAAIIRKHVNDNMSTITEDYVLSEMGDKFVQRGTINDCSTCKHNHLDHW